MKRLLTYLRRLLDDVLFQRVCTVLFTAPLVMLGGFLLAVWGPSGWEWLLWILLLFLAVYLGLILYAALFLSDAKFERAASHLEMGGEPVALVFVAVIGVVAVPITILIRKLRSRSNAL